VPNGVGGTSAEQYVANLQTWEGQPHLSGSEKWEAIQTPFVHEKIYEVVSRSWLTKRARSAWSSQSRLSPPC